MFLICIIWLRGILVYCQSQCPEVQLPSIIMQIIFFWKLYIVNGKRKFLWFPPLKILCCCSFKKQQQPLYWKVHNATARVDSQEHNYACIKTGKGKILFIYLLQLYCWWHFLISIIIIIILPFQQVSSKSEFQNT